VYIYVYMYVYICMYLYIYVCMCVCVYIYMYVCVYVYIYMYVFIYMYVLIYMYVCVYIYISVVDTLLFHYHHRQPVSQDLFLKFTLTSIDSKFISRKSHEIFWYKKQPFGYRPYPSQRTHSVGDVILSTYEFLALFHFPLSVLLL
jgi:hypothetical protein